MSTSVCNPLDRVNKWFADRGWTPWPFQRDAWSAYAAGESGLIHVPTGAGKTYAAFGGPLADLLDEAIDTKTGELRIVRGVRHVLITPLRAVSRDTALALELPLRELGALAEVKGRGPHKGVIVETRTGDTSSSVKGRQRDRLPTVLVTTPESLTLLLTRPNARELFAGLQGVTCDEWHELLASKRGAQVELALARLRSFAQEEGRTLRTWGMSATLSNLDEAAKTLVGVDRPYRLVSGQIDRPIVIETILPGPGDPFPWAGHLGLSMLPKVCDAIDPERSTLIFVNTRSQAERWFSALQATKPEWFAILGLHHGSIDKAERERIEAGLKDGSVRLVVATSSLDLGVDFAPVERVFQIGSPKGIARLMQRAGRASHRPGEPCLISCVPTHAFEMLEVAAVRRAIQTGVIEPRIGEHKPLDVLTQHLVTVALGGGFAPDALYNEVRTAHGFRDLTREEFDWTLELARDGGESLKAYPEYHRVVADEEGVYRVEDKKLGHLHRLNIGTITSDAVMDIRFGNGKRIGVIEESFINQLRRGQKFVFAGRTLEYVRTKELTAVCKPASGRTTLTPLWGGTRMPISESLGAEVRAALEAARDDRLETPEADAVAPLVETQRRISRIPDADRTLCEITRTRDGLHLMLYPFEGRLVHGGLAALLALRLSRLTPTTFTTSVNDYGLELLTGDDTPLGELVRTEGAGKLFTLDGLLDDAIESVNLSALARSQFREVARVSGLVFQSYPGSPRSARQLQARAGLLFDVFEEFDPGNLLLHQARREVLEKQFERSRLGRTLDRLANQPLDVVEIARPGPLALPLVIERIGARLSSETLAQRIEKMRKAWER